MKFYYTPFGSTPVFDVERAVGCDGLPPSKLCLSHWPGNTTPIDLKRDLSTEIALAFAALSPADRLQRFGPLEFVTNDHFDTDGLLAIYSCLRPEAALPRAEILASCAAAGDLWRAPSDRAMAFDMAVSAATDTERSPLAGDFVNLNDKQREALAFQYLLDRMPSALDDPFSLKIQIDEEFKNCKADLFNLRNGREEIARDPFCDLAIFKLSRPHDPRATTEVAATDRILELQKTGDGTKALLRITARSWFDGMAARSLPRPDLTILVDRLQQNERNPGAWLATSTQDPFPSLTFGSRRDSGVRDAPFIQNPSSQSAKEITNIIVSFLREQRA